MLCQLSYFRIGKHYFNVQHIDVQHAAALQGLSFDERTCPAGEASRATNLERIAAQTYEVEQSVISHSVAAERLGNIR